MLFRIIGISIKLIVLVVVAYKTTLIVCLKAYFNLSLSHFLYDSQNTCHNVNLRVYLQQQRLLLSVNRKRLFLLTRHCRLPEFQQKSSCYLCLLRRIPNFHMEYHWSIHQKRDRNRSLYSFLMVHQTQMDELCVHLFKQIKKQILLLKKVQSCLTQKRKPSHAARCKILTFNVSQSAFIFKELTAIKVHFFYIFPSCVYLRKVTCETPQSAAACLAESSLAFHRVTRFSYSLGIAFGGCPKTTPLARAAAIPSACLCRINSRFFEQHSSGSVKPSQQLAFLSDLALAACQAAAYQLQLYHRLPQQFLSFQRERELTDLPY